MGTRRLVPGIPAPYGASPLILPRLSLPGKRNDRPVPEHSPSSLPDMWVATPFMPGQAKVDRRK
jgi:hypothetical protein